MGYASVGSMLRMVTSEEISEWRAYFGVKERWEEERRIAAKAKQSARDNNE